VNPLLLGVVAVAISRRRRQGTEKAEVPGPTLAEPSLRPYDYDSEVAGESFYREALEAIMADVEPGDDGWRHLPAELTLIADPRNRHDRRAVKVMAGHRQLGHIPRAELDWFHRTLPRRHLRRGINVPGLIYGSGEVPYAVRYHLGL
jgi:hypothetical protein